MYSDTFSIRGATNDAGWLRFNESTANAGYLELASGDDGTEPIYVRQYSAGSIAHAITLIDANGHQTFNNVTVQQVLGTGRAVSWYQGRDAALLRMTTSGTSQYKPIWSAKSINGSWDCGTYTNNYLHFSYITDANYSAGTNTQTANIYFTPGGSIVANTFTKVGGTAAQYLKADGSVSTLNDATTSAAGLMSAADKTKVNNTPTFWSGTQAQYDAITTKDNSTVYLIYEEE